MKALIAGAGIGGLTTALFLHEAGFEVELFERADDIRELGVGINMLPHAVKALAALGLMPALDAEGVDTRACLHQPLRPNRMQELRGIDAGYEVPQISIHRGRLLGLIHRAVLNRLGGDVISTASLVDAFEQSEGEVVAHFRRHDGSRGEAHGDLLIGADGIHSAVRAVLYPEEGPPIWNGTMLWRGATPWPVWRDGRTMAVAGGNFAKFVYYPIEPDREEPETRLTNWAVMAHTGDRGTSPLRPGDWSRPGVIDDVLPFVRDRFQLDFVDPASIIQATDGFYEYPNCDRDPLPRWSFGRVTLLGDAAHPMYPVGSNGASQAILDAGCLAMHLAAGPTVEAALARYDGERRPATSAIVLANRQGGPEAVIDMVESRAPHGFDDIDVVASREERKSVVRGYASLAGFAKPN